MPLGALPKQDFIPQGGKAILFTNGAQSVGTGADDTLSSVDLGVDHLKSGETITKIKRNK